MGQEMEMSQLGMQGKEGDGVSQQGAPVLTEKLKVTRGGWLNHSFGWKRGCHVGGMSLGSWGCFLSSHRMQVHSGGADVRRRNIGRAEFKHAQQCLVGDPLSVNTRLLRANKDRELLTCIHFCSTSTQCGKFWSSSLPLVFENRVQRRFYLLVYGEPAEACSGTLAYLGKMLNSHWGRWRFVSVSS